MEQLISEGKCIFCNKTFKKAGISRHLNTHLAEKIKDNKRGISFHIKVEPDIRWGASPYFLNLWVDGNTSLREIDNFLRQIWLECCGHMSAFRDSQKRTARGGMWGFFEASELMAKGKTKEYEEMVEQSTGEIPMSRKVKDVFYKGQKLEYEYDFGSTTELKVTAIEEFPVKADKSIVLLSRNEPLKIMCDMCHKKPATQLCTECADEDDGAYCDSCAKKHAKTCEAFADYAALPMVNSPRMGVCAYEGGAIDKERDGVYVA